MSLYDVWFVDDRPENLESFRKNHGAEFNIKLFSQPDEVLQALRAARPPDALLCDIYFYEDESLRESIEAQVKREAKKLADSVGKSGDSASQEGIRLISRIRDEFGGAPPFPIFAYTSKAPYLMQTDGFNQLEDLNARLLLKGKYGPQQERNIILKGISDLEREKRAHRMWRWVVATGILSAGLGVALDRLLRHFGF